MLCFYGFKMIEVTVGAMVFLLITLLMNAFIITIVFGSSLTSGKVIGATIFSAVIGGVGAFFLTKRATKIGVGLLTAWGLVTVAFLVVPLLGLNSEKYNIAKLVFYVILGVLGFYYSAKFAVSIEVYITAFIGAYGFVRGISLFAGGFINELDMDPEAIKEVEPIFFGYIAGILVMFALGVYV